MTAVTDTDAMAAAVAAAMVADHGAALMALDSADALALRALAYRYGTTPDALPAGMDRRTVGSEKATYRRRHLAAQGYRCAWCSEPLSDSDAQCDRVVSSRGYALKLTVAACRFCNALRGELAARGYALRSDRRTLQALPADVPTLADAAGRRGSADRAIAAAMAARVAAR